MSDVIPGRIDPNPILDKGCPRSVGGIESAAALAIAMGIDFVVRPLDCPPFLHGFGPKCENPLPVFGIWDLPLSDLNGIEVKIPFYLTLGDGPLLLGNKVISQSDVLGTQNLLVIPPNVCSLFRS